MDIHYLSPHIFLRSFGCRAILLDLHRDQYISLGHEEVLELARVVRGWPCPASSGNTGAAPPSTALTTSTARALLHQRVLTRNSTIGKIPTLLIAEAATEVIRSPKLPAPITWRHAIRFCRACLFASLLLRFCSIEHVIHRVERRKRLAQNATSSSAPPGAAQSTQLADLVFIFHRLRPLAYTASRTCLLNSLTLIEYLASYGIYPTWVFGVRIDPFAAHCWVQSGSMVLNGSLEYTADFAPIMAV